jgi:hypothetical protein
MSTPERELQPGDALRAEREAELEADLEAELAAHPDADARPADDPILETGARSSEAALTVGLSPRQILGGFALLAALIALLLRRRRRR